MRYFDRRSMIRSSLAATIALTSAGCNQDDTARPPMPAQPVATPPQECEPDNRLNAEKFADKWLRPEGAFDESGKVAAINMYGLIALLTQNGAPIGSLCVNGHDPSNLHEPRLWIRLRNLGTDAPTRDWENTAVGIGYWKMASRHFRVVQKGSAMPAAKASLATDPTEPWSNAGWLPAMNDIWPGLKPKSLTRLISQECATAYLEFSGGIVHVGVPFSEAGSAALWSFQSSTYRRSALTDNTWTLVPLLSGNPEVEIRVRPLGAGPSQEIVFATLKLQNVSDNVIPLFLSNDVPRLLSAPTPTKELHHNKAFWKLVESSPTYPTPRVPVFARGMRGQNDLKHLQQTNSGDPHCNGLRLEVL